MYTSTAETNKIYEAAFGHDRETHLAKFSQTAFRCDFETYITTGVLPRLREFISEFFETRFEDGEFFDRLYLPVKREDNDDSYTGGRYLTFSIANLDEARIYLKTNRDRQVSMNLGECLLKEESMQMIDYILGKTNPRNYSNYEGAVDALKRLGEGLVTLCGLPTYLPDSVFIEMYDRVFECLGEYVEFDKRRPYANIRYFEIPLYQTDEEFRRRFCSSNFSIRFHDLNA